MDKNIEQHLPTPENTAEKPPVQPDTKPITAEIRLARVQGALENLFANDSMDDLRASIKHWEEQQAAGTSLKTAERMLKKLHDEIKKREGSAESASFTKEPGDIIITQKDITSGEVKTVNPNLGLDYLRNAATIADALPQRAADLKAKQAAKDAELDEYLRQHGKSLN